MDLSRIKGEKRNHLLRSIYVRCKQMNAPLAVVGTSSSAELLMEIVQRGELPLAGLFDQEKFKKSDDVLGQPVQPIEQLAALPKNAVVIIASSAESTNLYDTFQRIRALCPCKTVHLKVLMDLFFLKEELKAPLEYQFDDFLFGRGFHPLRDEIPFWRPLPPDADFTGKTVLELGPCEGHDTVDIMSRNPKKLIALEARPKNFAKISVTRALYNWKNHELLLGDMHLFPQLVKEKIDVIICRGVFYHSDKPWWLLQSCMEHADTIYLAGHVASEHSRHHRTFTDITLDGEKYTFEIYPESGDHLAGLSNHSLWFFEKDLIRFFDHHGFEYRKYGEGMAEPTGWLIDAVVRRKRSPR
jgi:hypothetical protein